MAPILTVSLVSGEELGRFSASNVENLKRQLFALPRSGCLRQADPKSTQLVGKDGVLSEWQIFTEDQDLQILLAPRKHAISVLLRCQPPSAPCADERAPLVLDTVHGLVTDAQGKSIELDYVFDEADGSMLFMELWEDILLQSLKGRRALLLAYGAADSGKMQGIFGENGLVLKTHEFLQAHVRASFVAVEFIELVTEKAYDLLAGEAWSWLGICSLLFASRLEWHGCSN